MYDGAPDIDRKLERPVVAERSAGTGNREAGDSETTGGAHVPRGASQGEIDSGALELTRLQCNAGRTRISALVRRLENMGSACPSTAFLMGRTPDPLVNSDEKVEFTMSEAIWVRRSGWHPCLTGAPAS